ncbi:MAG: MFS transporter [Treponema sp.]|jgi:MFS family permease/HEAT repeat protein|nr:MFS transporter [Treponema sp.]
MQPALSPYRLGKAREVFNLFNVFNALSWNMLVGSIITLFAIRLGASSTYIGTLSALLYVSFFFLPLGKLFAQKFRIVSIFSFAWTARAVGMITVVFAPIAANLGHQDIALGLTMLGVGIFHIVRGIGMIGNNPVLNYLSTGPDRGSYMTQIQIINSAVGMFTGFAIAIVLGREPGLSLYSIIMAAGIVCGVTSGVLIRKVPEPPAEKKADKTSLAGVFHEAVREPKIKLFLIILLFVVLVSGVSRTFLVVYAREVFLQEDGMVLLYSVFGGLGNLLANMLIKFLVDRIGAKPIFILCVLFGFVMMIPIVFFPSLSVNSLTMAILFLSFLFFMLNFGFLGSEGIAQTYFMGLVPTEKMLDMGMLYFFVFGVAGAGGSFLAGLLLDILSALGLPPFYSFKILYSALVVLGAIAIIKMQKLTPLGALSFTGAVKVMFSYRDLQAISLLDRLDKTADSHQEQELLESLYNNPSQLSTKGLLEKARSPRLATRLEAIRALEKLDSLNEDAEAALIHDVINNPFTTAYISARILGNHGCVSAIPILRELASSQDYMLAGEAMISLARLRDLAFRPQVENIILEIQNPRLKIMGVEALGIYALPDSLNTFINIIKNTDPPPYLLNEVILAMSAILGTQDQFYRVLVRFVAEPSLAPALAQDEAEAAVAYYKSNIGWRKSGKKKNELPILDSQAGSIQAAVASLEQDGAAPTVSAAPAGSALSRWIQALPDFAFPDEPAFKTAQTLFPEVLADEKMAVHKCLRLLIVHWAAYQIRLWTQRLK